MGCFSCISFDTVKGAKPEGYVYSSYSELWGVPKRWTVGFTRTEERFLRSNEIGRLVTVSTEGTPGKLANVDCNE